MTLDVTLSAPRSSRHGWSATRREARLRRQRLARQARLVAQRGELHYIRTLLGDAVTVVAGGWVQHGWFLVTTEQGRQVRMGASSVPVMSTGTVTGACLVGAIVQAGGGPAAAHSQLVQRTLDLTWHVLYHDESQPPRWCPAPTLRAAHLRDLTRWNDEPTRTSHEVTELLHSAERAAHAQSDRLGSELALIGEGSGRATA